MTTESPASPCDENDRIGQKKPTEVQCFTISDDESRADSLLRNISANIGINSDSFASGSQGGSHDNHNVQSPPIPIIDISTAHEMSSVAEIPSIQVMFMNTSIGRKYRHEIENFFKTLMTAEGMKKNEDPLPRIQPRANLQLNVDGNEVPPTTVIGNIEIYRTCMVDRKGWPIIANMLSQTPGIDIPQYKQQYELDPYPPPDDADIVEIKPIKTSKTCFNCLGMHSGSH